MSSNTPAITVIDYGMGNVGSVVNMMRRIGVPTELSGDPDRLRSARKLILPGVGAFDHGVQQLRSRGLIGLLQERAHAGVPILGVCLGMQLLACKSEEGVEEGLALIDAECRRFAFQADLSLRVPHVGWNEPSVKRANPLLPSDDDRPRFYFTHSYHLICRDNEDVVATAHYGYEFPAIVARRNVFGVQFHPEKSHRFGMALLQRFAQSGPA